MKTLKGTALSMIGLVVAIAAVGCGDTIQGCQTTAQMFGWLISYYQIPQAVTNFMLAFVSNKYISGRSSSSF